MYSLSLPPLRLHQAELQMAQQENRRLNLELQEAKDRQEEQSAQASSLSTGSEHIPIVSSIQFVVLC